MNVSEFVVKYLKKCGVKHFFGYQGTMITYFVDAIGTETGVYNHSLYHEQGAALAACGFSKTSGRLSCAYSTSGPGAINLIQGVADAFYDSVPVVYITGQLNSYEYTHIKSLRQQGFQETNIIEITRSITKYNKFIGKSNDIITALPHAVEVAMTGRRGPVLLDIPMDVQKAAIELPDERIEQLIDSYTKEKDTADTAMSVSEAAQTLLKVIEISNRPIFLIGNGVHRDELSRNRINALISKYRIPVLSGLMSKDMILEEQDLYFGFVGSSYGQRSGNIIANKKADLIISFGCRLSTRLTGIRQREFAKTAKLYRVEIDKDEIKRKVHEDEVVFEVDVNELIEELLKHSINKTFEKWISVCREIKSLTDEFDKTCSTRYPNTFIQKISENFETPLVVVSDVGQNMMWVASSFVLHKNQELIFSGAHGAMGFSLPAAIGAYYASGKNVLCFAGDGGFQMNMQELQFVSRERLPIKIFVLNNNSLGMIAQVQDDYFCGRRIGTDPLGGFSSPDFSEISKAYGIRSFSVDNLEMLNNVLNDININGYVNEPILVQIRFNEQTFAHPKTYFGDEINNQRPYLPEKVYSRIMEL